MSRSEFRMQIRVGKNHLDDLNHVNNIVYLQWAQDIAKAHWESTVGADVLEASIWVVVRHEVDYKSAALEGDLLELVTFVEAFNGPFSIRCVEFYRAGKLIANTRTKWCMLDRNMKPRRVSPDVSDLF